MAMRIGLSPCKKIWSLKKEYCAWCSRQEQENASRRKKTTQMEVFVWEREVTHAEKDGRWKTVFAGERCQTKRTTRTLAAFHARRPFILITTANMITDCETLAKWSERKSQVAKMKRAGKRESEQHHLGRKNQSPFPSVAVLLLDVSLVTLTGCPLRHDYIYYSELSLLGCSLQHGAIRWPSINERCAVRSALHSHQHQHFSAICSNWQKVSQHLITIVYKPSCQHTSHSWPP